MDEKERVEMAARLVAAPHNWRFAVLLSSGKWQIAFEDRVNHIGYIVHLSRSDMRLFPEELAKVIEARIPRDGIDVL